MSSIKEAFDAVKNGFVILFHENEKHCIIMTEHDYNDIMDRLEYFEGMKHKRLKKIEEINDKVILVDDKKKNPFMELIKKLRR